MNGLALNDDQYSTSEPNEDAIDTDYPERICEDTLTRATGSKSAAVEGKN